MRDGAARARSREQGRKRMVHLGRIGTLVADRLRLVRSQLLVEIAHVFFQVNCGNHKPAQCSFLGASLARTQASYASPAQAPPHGASAKTLTGSYWDPYWGCGLRHFFHLDAAFFTPSPSLPPSPTPTPRAHKEEGAPSAACHLTLLSRLVKMGRWGAGASSCPSQGHLSE